MLTKLETKSNRVKGLCFHPKRPWILASLHNGLIQLWDYRIRTLLDRFDEHEGPVRGICFHNSQPLFVSGGDDYKIKVWNYKNRRCLFTLLGHLDYIRTVQFHHEYPWILSSSDDQTIRIWNWQSRECIAILTGHNHYVMCASFHPTDDLVVSASLDQTVRVWDTSGLRKKNVAPGGYDDGLRIARDDLFGNQSVIVKYVIEGHDRGVNWAAFHPTLPMIVSGADDRYVKLWRMNDSKAWEIETLRGHFNNVSCVLFHPKKEIILSNSEDKTIRVWDTSKRQGMQTFRREHDRFWILAAHPENNLFAAGHDSGLIVFKLTRERPAYTVHKGMCYYIKDRYLRGYSFSTGRDVPLMSIRRSKNVLGAGKRTLSYNPLERMILICSENDGGKYELYKIPTEKSKESTAPKRGLSCQAVFVARNRFAVLVGSNIVLHNLSNEATQPIPIPRVGIDRIFSAGPTSVLLRSESKVMLFDIQQRRSVAEVTAANIKYVSWSQKKEYVALIGKDTLIIATKKLQVLCNIHETIRLKSGTWNENDVFIYTTLNHIKYSLINGDHGVVRTLEVPIYIMGARKNKIFCLDREAKTRVIRIDTTEFKFKVALLRHQYSEIVRMAKPGSTNIVGQSIIAYLQTKGFPQVALNFVQDEKTKFNLALECGNIEAAISAAKALDDKESWHRLGVEALRQGNHQVVEVAYQRTKNFERLSFLYLITGNTMKLQKMLKISEMRNDVMGRFHNALYLGDIEERIKVLTDAGQYALAYATAKTHGLNEEAEALAEKLDVVPRLRADDTELMLPPIPVMRLQDWNWPLLTVSEGFTLKDDDSVLRSKEDVDAAEGASAGWPDEDDTPLFDEDNATGDGPPDIFGNSGDEGEPAVSGEQDLWGVDDDLEGLDEIEVGSSTKGSADGEFYVPPTPKPGIEKYWMRNSVHAAEHAAAGSIESAMELLHNQVGIVNFEPLKPYFLAMFMGSRAPIQCIASAVPLLTPVEAEFTRKPALSVTLQSLLDKLQNAYSATTKGAFSDALGIFISILHALLFVIVEDRKSHKDASALLGYCREYITGIRLELHKRTLKGKPLAQTTMAAYFTNCKLQPIHKMLSLRSAMKSAYRIKNFKMAGSFARRLLEVAPNGNVTTEARKVIRYADQNPTDAEKLDFDERNPFVVCGISFAPIYQNQPHVDCPYCGTAYLPVHKGKLCPTCKISEIGKECSGLVLKRPIQK